MDKQGLNKKIEDVQKKIPQMFGLSKTNYNTKIGEIENKIPSITSLVTTVVLNANATETKHKSFYINNLVSKATLNRKLQKLKVN